MAKRVRSGPRNKLSRRRRSSRGKRGMPDAHTNTHAQSGTLSVSFEIIPSSPLREGPHSRARNWPVLIRARILSDVSAGWSRVTPPSAITMTSRLADGGVSFRVYDYGKNLAVTAARCDGYSARLNSAHKLYTRVSETRFTHNANACSYYHHHYGPPDRPTPISGCIAFHALDFRNTLKKMSG